MTIADEVTRAAKLFGVDRDELSEKVHEMLDYGPELFYADGERTAGQAVDALARQMAREQVGV